MCEDGNHTVFGFHTVVTVPMKVLIDMVGFLYTHMDKDLMCSGAAKAFSNVFDTSAYASSL